MTEIFRGNMSSLLSMLKQGIKDLSTDRQTQGEDEEGLTFCPSCLKMYEPDFKTIDECQTMDQREQHISGVCSPKCWDAIFPEDEYDRE